MRSVARKIVALGALAGIVGLAALAGRFAPPPPEPPATDYVTVAEVVQPITLPSGIVFLLSGADGYGEDERMTARTLRAGGAMVVGIDTKETFRRAEDQPSTDCAYLVSDVEAISQKLQRDLGGAVYHDPIIVGAGQGGTLALAMAAQSPNATIGRTLAVDPDKALALGRELCTGAPHISAGTVPAGWIYGLQSGPLPDPIEVVSTPSAPADGKQHVDLLVREGFASPAGTSPAPPRAPCGRPARRW